MLKRSGIDVTEPSKRVKTDPEVDKPAPLTKGASFILVDSGTPHASLGKGIKVRLRPWILTESQGGTINRIAINGRTPSPFGKAMGDHTVAWQVVVDEIHARLYGQTVDAAMATLKAEHESASGWMKTRGTPGKLLLRELDDIAPRWLRLEDATYYVNKHLQAAVASSKADVKRRKLTLALAYHLAYLNYLPFGTVPAKSALGSHGSAEGTHRAALVTYEKGRRDARLKAAREKLERQAAKSPLPDEDGPELMQTDDPDPAEIERLEMERRAAAAPGLLTALWGLFDFSAALRESHLEYALLGSIAINATISHDAIKTQYDLLIGIATKFRDDGAADDAQKKLNAINTKATELQEKAVYEGFRYAAGLIRDYSKDLTGTLLGSARTRKSVGGKIVVSERLNGAMTGATQTLEEIKLRATGAPGRAALVLSALLRRHLTALAAAYPNSVRDSGLLKPTAADAAYAKLAETVRATPQYQAGGTKVGEVLTALKDPFLANFASSGTGTVAIATSESADDWIVDAGNSGLVVTWNATKHEMEVNGRAPAPEGVQGMGSHTTAWVLECQALNAIIGGATDPVDVLYNLRGAVLEDLDGKVIKLDELLPAAQLEGNQLTSLFKSAADVLGATTDTGIEAAARAYLEFRNLLPFATVDEGTRTGRGEGSSITMASLFDGDSLAEAAGNIADALKNAKQAQEIAAALMSASDELSEAAKSKDSKWPDEVKEAAKAAARRLAKRSKVLGNAITDKSGYDEDKANADRDRIGRIRKAEHKLVYELVYRT